MQGFTLGRGLLLAAGLLVAQPSLGAVTRAQPEPQQVREPGSASDFSAQVAKRGKKRKKGRVATPRGKARAARKAATRKGRRGRRGKRGAAKAASPAPAPELAPIEGAGDPIVSTRRGPARVDFDDRLIQGQTNKSGAIYIFERKSSDINSMVRRRTSFRDEILRTLE